MRFLPEGIVNAAFGIVPEWLLPFSLPYLEFKVFRAHSLFSSNIIPSAGRTDTIAPIGQYQSVSQQAFTQIITLPRVHRFRPVGRLLPLGQMQDKLLTFL